MALPIPQMMNLSANSNNTSCDEFLDLSADSWVPHVLLERGRVTLSLLQNSLHHGILHYTHDLNVKSERGARRLW